MKAIPIYFSNPERFLICIWCVGMEEYKNPIVFTVVLKPNDRRSEYGFVESCSLHDHVDDRNGNPTLEKNFLKGWQEGKDKRTNISFVSYCTFSQRFVPKACLKYFLLFLFFIVIVILKILKWWWLRSHFWWAV